MKNGKPDSAIIIGTYINAFSIYRSLRYINFMGDIYVLDAETNTSPSFIEMMTKDIILLKTRFGSNEEFVDIINKIEGNRKFVFLTNEEYLDILKEAMESNKIKNVVAFTGSLIDNKLILNRYEFYQFIEKNNLAFVPRTILSEENPFEVLGDIFIIRPNNSWEGGIKTPRLSIVHTEEELNKIEKEYLELGMTREMWCYQEVLSSVSQHNLSVCGWFDAKDYLFVVTRKVVQHPPKTGCGDIVEIVENYPKELLRYTKNILSALKYRGAFELEFVYDTKRNRFSVIELNPRYWMQHELIEKNTDYYLIRKNLGQAVSPKYKMIYKYWVNTNQFLYRILCGQIHLLKYVVRSVKAPGIIKSLRWSTIYLRYRK